jgi:hypothetical protein
LRQCARIFNKAGAGRIAALRFSQAIQGKGLLDRKAPSLKELSTQFRSWVESAGLASKTRKYSANGWRLLSSTSIVGMRLDQITKDHVEVLRFGGSAAKLKLCITNVAPDAPQRRRAESPHQGSEIQAVAGAWTQTKAG